MEEMSGMDSLDAEREEEVVETSVHGESASNTQCTNVESPDVVGEEFEQDKSQSEETVREKRAQSEQTQLEVLNPDCPRRRYPERKRRPPNRLSLDMSSCLQNGK